MLFWIVAALGTLGVAGLLIAAVLRPRAAGGADAAVDVQVYRDQLAEVDRDVARGTLTEDEAQRVRVEVSRRLLEADKAARAVEAGARAPAAMRYAGAGLVALGLAGALALYAWLGAPGYPDLPLTKRIAMAEAARENRPPQAEAEAAQPAPPPVPADSRYMELMRLLRQAVADKPDDLEGLKLLAQHEARLGNFKAAYEAQGRVIEVRGDAATGEDYANLAELMIMAAGGDVTPEAEQVLTRAMELDPQNGPARYFFGLSFAQTGRPDVAFRIWSDLLSVSTDAAPWVRPIEAQMPDLARLAGVRWTPPDRPGPSAEDIAAAEDMTAEERVEMIRGMVEGLLARLAEQGGPPEEWARAVQSLGVLGNREQARAIYEEAQGVFAADEAALATLRAAAERAGVAE